MTLVSPDQSAPLDEINASDINNPVNQIAAVVNGNLDDTNIASLSGTKITSATLPPSASTTAGNVETRQSEIGFDFVASGCVWSGDSYGSTLAGSMTAGVVYVNGKRVVVSAVTAHAFTASKDTYIDVGEDGVVDYTEVANNAASPALAASHLRLGIIVTGASSIAAVGSVNQGQEDKVLPVASSIPYAVADSLGNLICPRDPQRRVLGYREILSAFTSTTTPAIVDVTGLEVSVIVPTGRKIRVSAFSKSWRTSNATAATSIFGYIRESTTTLSSTEATIGGANWQHPFSVEYVRTVSAGLHTFKVSISQTAAGTVNLSADATYPAYILVELV